VSFFFFEYQVILLYTITQNKNLLVVEMVVQCLARGILFQAINSCTDISSLSINFAGRPHRHVPWPADVPFTTVQEAVPDHCRCAYGDSSGDSPIPTLWHCCLFDCKAATPLTLREVENSWVLRVVRSRNMVNPPRPAQRHASWHFY